MKDELITYDTAVLAKEKGAVLEAGWYYAGSNRSYRYQYGIWYQDTREPYEETNYPTPTQSLLQRWLREKHNIILYVQHMGLWQYVIKWHDIAHKEQYGHGNSSYEGELEAGLQAALKLIVITEKGGFTYTFPITHKTVDDVKPDAKSLDEIPDRKWRIKYGHDLWHNPITVPDGYVMLQNKEGQRDTIQLGDIHFDLYSGWTAGGEKHAAAWGWYVTADGRWVAWARKIIPDAKPEL